MGGEGDVVLGLCRELSVVGLWAGEVGGLMSNDDDDN